MTKQHTGKIETDDKQPVADAATLSRRQVLSLAGAASAGVLLACGEEGRREVVGGMVDMSKSPDMRGGPYDLAYDMVPPPCMPKIATGGEKLGVNQVMPFFDGNYRDRSFYLVRDSKGFYALNDDCSHNHCQPNFNQAALTFDCPCHGSRFNFDGSLLQGPAPTPMKVFPMRKLANGQLEVDVCRFTTDRTGRVT